MAGTRNLAAVYGLSLSAYYVSSQLHVTISASLIFQPYSKMQAQNAGILWGSSSSTRQSRNTQAACHLCSCILSLEWCITHSTSGCKLEQLTYNHMVPVVLLISHDKGVYFTSNKFVISLVWNLDCWSLHQPQSASQQEVRFSFVSTLYTRTSRMVSQSHQGLHVDSNFINISMVLCDSTQSQWDTTFVLPDDCPSMQRLQNADPINGDLGMDVVANADVPIPLFDSGIVEMKGKNQQLW